MTQAISEGHFPVRWTDDFGYGYGMPLFEFYGPLPYYVGSFIYWLSQNAVFATKSLFVIANVVSVLGSYLLGRSLFGKKGGLVVAAAYALAPYRAVNLFVRGAIGESWGMMAMPLILWAGLSFIRYSFQASSAAMAKTKPTLHLGYSEIATRRWWWLVASLCVLFLSHNLSTLMFAPVSVFVISYFVIFGFSSHVFTSKNETAIQKKVYVLMKIALAYVLAMGVSAFYLLPAFVEKDNTVIGTILSGYFHYSHHFLYIRQFLIPNWGYGGSSWGPDDQISFFLGYGQLLATFFGFLLAFVAARAKYSRQMKNSSKKHVPNIQKWLIAQAKTPHIHVFFVSILMLGGSLYLTLLKSKFIWDTLPLISYIQFPWRWISVGIIFLSLLAGYGIILIKNTRYMYVTVGIILVVLLHNAVFFRPEFYLDTVDSLYYTDTQRIRREMSGILPDYIPKDLSVDVMFGPEELDEHQTVPVNSDGAAVLTHQNEEIVVTLVNQTHQKLVEVTAETDSVLTFAIANYPGWQVEIDGEQIKAETTPTGLISVNVPSGKHLVGARWGGTAIRNTSDAISLLSLCVVVFLMLPKKTASNDSKK